ncbi:MAG: class I SAM-dependent methyltransferase [Verrucomicrobia bacterium]|nr:class I SAM-dependent methyltransferase [Verrucomicrobiota bacterium]
MNEAARCTWQTLDWAALDRLRDAFLSGAAATGPYWQSRSDLANYDLTFAQRIGWKWDAVLAELKRRGWSPPRGPMTDWGCGSGVASRCVLNFFGTENFTALRLYDRSPLAVAFATERAREKFPKLAIETDMPEAGAPGTLILSHVLNELAESSRAELLQLVARADAVLWVEPGTHADSRALIALRESLRENFHLIAPCTHQAACGMLATGNERHWCHHFATPPVGLMADSDWVKFAQRAGVDLRSLPYSFLVLERKGRRAPAPGLLADGWSRVIGAPRVYKGFAKVVSCQAEGVRELEMQKRDAPEVFKAMEKGRTSPVYRWEVEGERIKSAQTVGS